MTIMRSMKPPNRIGETAEELFHVREARGLEWSLIARLVVLGVFFVLIILHFLRWIRPGIAAESDTEAVGTLLLEIFAGACILYFLRLARSRTKLHIAGLGAVVVDLVVVSLLPVIWSYNLLGPGGSPAFLLKNDLAMIAIVFIIINALALRPLYPAIATLGFILQQFVIAAYVLAHPATRVTPAFLEHFYTDALNPGASVVRILFLFIAGGALTFLAWTARNTIKDMVELEVTNREIRERQAALVLEGKITAMSDLVAGVAHEVNTPLGVLKSGVATVESATRRLAELALDAGADVARANKLVDITHDNAETARAGVERIATVANSLRDFAKLDEADLQRVDLSEGVENTLALIERDKFGAVELVKDISSLPPVLCRPKELNQVFMTIVVNALEALDGDGELRVVTAVVANEVVVEIVDTGPGIPSDTLAELFELRFRPSRGRMAMGLGLPTARRIVERHGGRLTVRSELGAGTAFRISLPLDPSASRVSLDTPLASQR